jgi:hypothetical protein
MILKLYLWKYSIIDSMKVVKGKHQDKLWVKPSPVKKSPFCRRVSPHPHHWFFNVNEDDQAEAMLNAGASA